MRHFRTVVLALTLQAGTASAAGISLLFEENYFCTNECGGSFDQRILFGALTNAYPDLQKVESMETQTLAAGLARTDLAIAPYISRTNSPKVATIPQATIDVMKRFVEGGGRMAFKMHEQGIRGTADLAERISGVRFGDATYVGAATYTCDAAVAMALGWQSAPASGRSSLYGVTLNLPASPGVVPICKTDATHAIVVALPVGDGMIYFDGIYNASMTDYSAEQRQITTEMATSDLVAAHRCFLENETVKCSGGNSNGQLGVGDKDPHVATYGALEAVDLGAGFRVARVANATGSSCAVSASGDMKCWGLNKDGQLGLGDVRPRGGEAGDLGDQLPVMDLGARVVDLGIGRTHVCALTEDFKLHCWGKGSFGQLGSQATATVGAQQGDRPVLPDVGGRVVQVRSGRNHTCVLLADQQVACFGSNVLGQLGNGTAINVGDRAGTMGAALARVDLGAGFKATKIALGLEFGCALSDAGRIKCWGSNDAGQLGQGEPAASKGTSPSEMGDALPFVDLGDRQLATDLQCGFYHCCAKTLQNTMKCWGANDAGQLGIGDSQSRGRGADMGDQLPFTKLPAGERVQSMDLNGNTTCATTDSGMRCWGGNTSGQLATGDRLNRGDKPQTVPRLLAPMF